IRTEVELELIRMTLPKLFQSGATRNRTRSRCGVSLVEMLVVVTLMSMLLATITTVAVRLRQWDRQMRDNSFHGDQVAALADALRTDAGDGTDLKLLSKDTLVIENADKREVRYTLQSKGCRREVKSADKASTSTDIFTIGPFEAWKVEPGPAG